MRFKLSAPRFWTETYDEQWKRLNLREYQPWFAWYPVKAEDEYYYWLTTVERKSIGKTDPWVYRALEVK